MGWLKIGSKTKKSHPYTSTAFNGDLKYTTQHLEDVSIDSNPITPLPPVPIAVSDSELPFIHKQEVRKRTSAANGGILIVIDNIVYDCTQFISEHPGGEEVISSFGGGDCSWQFWRFHGKQDLEEFGQILRVGRTEGLVNRFPEPVRYVGLKKLGDEWD